MAAFSFLARRMMEVAPGRLSDVFGVISVFSKARLE